MINYNNYEFGRQEGIIYLLKGILLSAVIGFLFYQHIWGVLLLLPYSIHYLKKQKRRLCVERKWKLNQEFKDGILSLSAALNAGYSIENSFSEALKDLSHMYTQNDMVVCEFLHIVHQLRMNRTVEDALQDFAQRSGVEDIYNFADVFVTAKRTGGNIIRVIATTCKTIGDKIEVKREIQTLITAKQMESRIMNVIPCGILVYLLLSSPGFLDPLYGNIPGILIMSTVLLVYYGTILLSEKIVHIEV